MTSADACHNCLQAEKAHLGPGAKQPAPTFTIQAAAGGAGLQGGSAASHSSLEEAAICRQRDLQATCERLQQEVRQARAAAEQERGAAQKAQAMADQEEKDRKALQQQQEGLQGQLVAALNAQAAAVTQAQGLHQALEDARRHATSADAEREATRSSAAQEQVQLQAMCASLTAGLEAARTGARQQEALHASAAVEVAQLRAQRQNALNVLAAAEAEAKAAAEQAQQQEALRASAAAQAATKAAAGLAQLRSQAAGVKQALRDQVAALQEEVGRQSASAAAAQHQTRALADLFRQLEQKLSREAHSAAQQQKALQQRIDQLSAAAAESQQLKAELREAQTRFVAIEQRLRDRLAKLKGEKVSREPVGVCGWSWCVNTAPHTVHGTACGGCSVGLSLHVMLMRFVLTGDLSSPSADGSSCPVCAPADRLVAAVVNG